MMANVQNPCFSLWASGSLGKTLTYNARYNGNKFSCSMYKQRAGKRHEIQIENSEIFKIRTQAIAKSWDGVL